MKRVLVIATGRKTRGGITSVIKAHETGPQWKKYHCHWIQTHRDGPVWRKICYLMSAWVGFLCRIPFYSIVHIHCAGHRSAARKLFFAKVSRLLGKKIIIHFHPSAEKLLFEEPWRTPTLKLFDLSDMIIVLSPYWGKKIRQASPESNYNIKVLYNPCPTVERHKGKSAEKYVLYAGILNDRKGYNRLLEAFAKVADRHKDWKLKFAGNGEIEQAKELQRSLGLNDARVKYLGWITGIDKDLVFNGASIYCLPSWGEGFPMGVLDAMAYGIPVVTTPVGGIDEILENGKDCIITPIGDVDALAGALNHLIEDGELRFAMVENADKRKDNDFNLKNICRQLDQLYCEI